jgi:hypothetical protein
MSRVKRPNGRRNVRYLRGAAGDLLSAARRPGMLEKASLWVRWFESDRIVARAIDNPTDPDDQFINVYFMPDLTMEED